jgi:hypothetical protein
VKRKPPVITSPFGETTEWARKQAAENMRADPAVMIRVIEFLTRQMGSEERGLAEAKRRYPEAFIGTKL